MLNAEGLADRRDVDIGAADERYGKNIEAQRDARDSFDLVVGFSAGVKPACRR